MIEEEEGQRLIRLAGKISGRAWYFVAGRYPGGLAGLQRALGCDTLAACRVGLLPAPAPGEDLGKWCAQVADFAGVDKERLRAVAQVIQEVR